MLKSLGLLGLVFALAIGFGTLSGATASEAAAETANTPCACGDSCQCDATASCGCQR